MNCVKCLDAKHPDAGFVLELRGGSWGEHHGTSGADADRAEGREGRSFEFNMRRDVVESCVEEFTAYRYLKHSKTSPHNRFCLSTRTDSSIS